ncbi:MAG: aspartate aminotransferase family protein [Rhizobiaceae bacterium]|nr:aspartate aminotransferase family protein [Rhizobiaceae bacterium]
MNQAFEKHHGRNSPDQRALWMPFTPNRATLADPMRLVGADGAYYTGEDGRKKFDGVSGLWCCNAGHNHPHIVETVTRQLRELDYAPNFLYGHPGAFDFAARLAALAPGDLNHVFFTNSGSEATDTALKIALAYHQAKGDGKRTMLVGRERAFHGVGFGGISVGGMVANRRAFGNLLPRVAHLRHTYLPEQNRFCAGEAEHGVELADDLQRIVDLHGGDTIAAVIVEPMAGSTGILPPPRGYLARLREICDRHSILLIFDEVITAFGRLGHTFAAERFGVQPDMICFAKGVSSGVVPLGGVMIRSGIYDAFMQGPDYMIELFHGYTYSGHPLAMAAGSAAMDVYEQEGLFQRGLELEPVFAEHIMSLKDHTGVTDVRCIGLAGAIDLAPDPAAPTTRGRKAFLSAYHDQDLVIRYTADTLVFAPPLVSTEAELAALFEKVGTVLRALSK